MTTPIIPKADEVKRYDTTGSDFDHAEHPDGDWVHYEDHLRVVGELRALLSDTRAPSPAVGGEVSEEEVERALHDALDVIGAAWSIRALSVTAYDLRNMMRAALEAFVRGRGKS